MATVLIMLPRRLLLPLFFYLMTGRFGPLGSTASPTQIMEDLCARALWFPPYMLLSFLGTGALITVAASIYQGKPISSSGSRWSSPSPSSRCTTLWRRPCRSAWTASRCWAR